MFSRVKMKAPKITRTRVNKKGNGKSANTRSYKRGRAPSLK